MKKFFLSLGLGITLASGVFAADDRLNQLNEQLVSVLAPFQNQTTEAKLIFNTIETNVDRVLKVAVNSFYRKIGSQNKLELKIDNLSYDYSDGVTPRAILRGSVNVDITKILSREELDQTIPDIEKLVEQFVESSTEKYSDAVSVKGVLTSTTKNDNGNYTALTALISIKLDLKKLPEDVDAEEIMATDVGVSLSIDLEKGVTIDAFVDSNPGYKGFKKGQMGLKEGLEALLAGDEKTLSVIRRLLGELDEIALFLVEKSTVKVDVSHLLAMLKS